MKLFST
jgi:hypothetical protein